MRADVNHNFFDPHLLPQSHAMDFWTNWGLTDPEVIVASLDDMDRILAAMKGDNVKRAVLNSRQSDEKKSTDELNDEIVQRLCRMYEVDLVLLEELGLTDPNCHTPDGRRRFAPATQVWPQLIDARQEESSSSDD